MKRCLTVFFLLGMTSLSLGASYALADTASLSLVSYQPLMPANIADPHAGTTHVNVMYTHDNPSEIWVTDYNGNNDYTPIPFKDADSSLRSYWRMKVGMDVGLLRVTLPNLQAELNLQGYLNTVFEFYGNSDMVGFDGSYTVAAQARLHDTWTFRLGVKHFSGHYGDEYLRRLFEYSQGTNTPLNPGVGGESNQNYARLVEYTRDNSWLAAVGYEPSGQWAFSLTAMIPMLSGSSFIRPGVHAPDGWGGSPYGEKITQDEQVGHTSHNPWYIGLDLALGAQYTHPLFEGGDLIIGGYLQLHQDGQTRHKPGGYSPSNPWDVEFSAMTALDLTPDTPSPMSFRLEASYHAGRFPLQNFFYLPTQYFAIGMGIGM